MNYTLKLKYHVFKAEAFDLQDGEAPPEEKKEDVQEPRRLRLRPKFKRRMGRLPRYLGDNVFCVHSDLFK